VQLCSRLQVQQSKKIFEKLKSLPQGKLCVAVILVNMKGFTEVSDAMAVLPVTVLAVVLDKVSGLLQCFL